MKYINHYIIIFRNLIRPVCFIILFMHTTPLRAQINTTVPVHNCNHLCAHTRVSSTSIGIYDQDPRLHDYDVKFYGLDLQVDPATTFLDGSVRILAEVTATSMSYFVLELTNELSVSTVELGDEFLAFSHHNQILEIELGGIFDAGTMIDLVVFYSGEPQPQGFFAGITSSNNNFGDPVLWTLSEPHNARQWFPCKQVLDDKADSLHVTITTPPGFTAASNGLLTKVTEQPDGTMTYHWKSFYPIAYYLISIAVSNYQEYNFYAPLSSAQDSVFVQNFIYNYPQVLEAQRENLERTRDFMQLFSQIWGDYPFSSEKYGHAQAPMGGAMEHQTISTMGAFGFDITAHELAHHWFGNQVTCATWSDIWINEGFASYGEYLAREFILGRESADAWMKNAHSNIKSQPGGSIYVPPLQLTDIWRIFNGRLSYRKGAAMLHLLRYELDNDELFFHIMEDFQQTFAHDAATGDDFRMTIDLNTGESWEWFFDQWYYGEGYPIYELLWWQEDNDLFIRSSQITSTNHPSFFKGTLEFKVTVGGDEQYIRVFQHEPFQVFELPLGGKVEQIVFDPHSYMLKEFVLIDSTGIIDPGNLTDLSFGPNPVIENLTLYLDSNWNNSQYFVSDLQGRVLLEGRLLSDEHTIYMAGLTTGMYLVNVVSLRGMQKTFRFLKK